MAWPAVDGQTMAWFAVSAGGDARGGRDHRLGHDRRHRPHQGGSQRVIILYYIILYYIILYYIILLDAFVRDEGTTVAAALIKVVHRRSELCYINVLHSLIFQGVPHPHSIHVIFLIHAISM